MLINYFIELKNRILLILGMWLVLVITGYYYKETTMFIITKPCLIFFSKNYLYFISTNLTELFVSYINSSYFIATQITLIYSLYHLLVFLTPGFYYKEYKIFKNIYLILLIFFNIHFILFNKIFIPVICKFLLKSQKILSNQFLTLYFEAKINEYLDFYMLLYKLCFLLCFIFLCLLLLNTYLIKKKIFLFIIYNVIYIHISTRNKFSNNYKFNIYMYIRNNYN